MRPTLAAESIFMQLARLTSLRLQGRDQISRQHRDVILAAPAPARPALPHQTKHIHAGEFSIPVEQRRLGLVRPECRRLLVYCQVCQKCFDRRCAHVLRMTLVVIQDETSRLGGVCLLHADAEATGSKIVVQAVEELAPLLGHCMFEERGAQVAHPGNFRLA